MLSKYFFSRSDMIFLLCFSVADPLDYVKYLPENAERQNGNNTEYKSHYNECAVKAVPAIGCSEESETKLAAIKAVQ